MTTSQILADAWHQLASLLSAANLQVWLLVGSGILAISLLVLALTRWGHSRPVWKCVILSFIAHILLLGYAYATYVMLEPPVPVVAAEPMRVNLIEEVGESLEARAKHQPKQKDNATAWDRVADQPIEAPALEPLNRPLVDSELVVEPAKEERNDASQSAASRASRERLKTPRPLPSLSSPQQLASAAQRVDSAPSVTQVPDSLPIDAQPIKVARRGESLTGDPTDSPNFEDSFERDDLPREQIEPLAVAGRPSVEPLIDNKPARQPPAPLNNRARFAGSQPINDQLANATRDLPFARQAKIGSKSGGLAVMKRQLRLGDGQALPEVYSLRSSKDRLATARRHGGSVLTERAVNAAFGWLVINQETDGSWNASQAGAGRETKTFGHDRDNAGANADTGVTALATLALLAGGHSHFEGSYKQNVQRALEYLISQQSRDGNLAGDAKLFARMYCHSMSLLALSEALAMTGDQRLLPAVQRGVDYCVAAQNRNDGGWRYQPGDGGDMSQFGWVVMALRSAKLGGAVVPAKTFQQMRYFLKRCSSGVGNSLAAYRPGQGASTSMTAEALFCRYLLDDVPAKEGLRTASRRISQESPSLNRVNLYYWYYGTLAMRHVGGDAWNQWNARLKATLVSLQETSGRNAGSWDPTGVWGGYGGRVYSTAMAALNLEVYYRYLPSHEFTGR